MKHLVIDISAHGFGHIAQTAAVLNQLETANLRLTIRSNASVEKLQERITPSFEFVSYQQDMGMIMHDALRVDAEATIEWYRDFHSSYAARKSQAIEDLTALKADVIFANVPYLSLDAAVHLGIPTVALCSLNWADIFQTYCGHFEEAEAIHRDIQKAYSSATCFIQPTPSMPMHNLPNTKIITPIALKGTSNREALYKATNTDSSMSFVLVGLGGIGMNFSLENWPRIDNVRWIFEDINLYLPRDDFVAISEIELTYVDLLTSCDVVLTKTGYGTQTEAVVNKTPTLCVKRGIWPEEPCLAEWHQRYGEVEFIEWADIERSTLFEQKINSLLNRLWSKDPIEANGASEAAYYLQECLNTQAGHPF